MYVYEKITGNTSSATNRYSVITNDTLNLNSLLSGTQISQEDIDELSSKYTDIIIDKLDDDHFEKEKKTIDVNGDDTDVNKVTLNINRSERSEERRVGKECRCGRAPGDLREKE